MLKQDGFGYPQDTILQNDSVISDRKLLNQAIVTYSEEYTAFKKKWTIICIAVGCVMYIIPGIILYNIYSLRIRPEFERKLIERYKKEHLR